MISLPGCGYSPPFEPSDPEDRELIADRVQDLIEERQNGYMRVLPSLYAELYYQAYGEWLDDRGIRKKKIARLDVGQCTDRPVRSSETIGYAVNLAINATSHQTDKGFKFLVQPVYLGKVVRVWRVA